MGTDMRAHVSIILSGQVQGVNLRSMVKVRAITLNVVGSVKNLPDGTVRIEAEGERETLEQFMRWLNSHPASLRFDTIEDYWSEPRGTFSSFAIE